MALPQATYSYGRNIEAPDITRAGALVANAFQGIRDRELEDMKIAKEDARVREDQRRWDITNSRADALANMQEDEYNRALAEKNATNEAYKVLMNKDQYANEKMAAEQKAIQESLAMLTPQERAVAEQQLKSSYNPEVSRQQWLDNAISGPNVDQSKVVAMKTNLYNIAANTPGTPEYEAKINEEKKMDQWKSNLLLGQQKNLIDYNDSKEASRMQNLVKGLTTGTVGTTSTTTDNSKEIETANKWNAKLESNLTNYGNDLNKAILTDKSLQGTVKGIDSLTNRLDAEMSKSNPDINAINSMTNTKKILESNRDKRIMYLDEIAKRNNRIEENYQNQFIKVPNLQQSTESSTYNLSSTDWLKQAVANVQPKTKQDVDVLLARQKELYPTATANERLKLEQEKQQAKDLKELIKNITGKEATSSTVESLSKELTTVSKNNTSGKINTTGAGPLTLKALQDNSIDDWTITSDKSNQQTILDLPKSYKVSDKDLAAIIAAYNTGTFTRSSTIANDVENYVKANYEPIKK